MVNCRDTFKFCNLLKVTEAFFKLKVQNLSAFNFILIFFIFLLFIYFIIFASENCHSFIKHHSMNIPHIFIHFYAKILQFSKDYTYFHRLTNISLRLDARSRW